MQKPFLTNKNQVPKGKQWWAFSLSTENQYNSNQETEGLRLESHLLWTLLIVTLLIYFGLNIKEFFLSPDAAVAVPEATNVDSAVAIDELVIMIIIFFH
jgi:hypothetical protein